MCARKNNNNNKYDALNLKEQIKQHTKKSKAHTHFKLKTYEKRVQLLVSYSGCVVVALWILWSVHDFMIYRKHWKWILSLAEKMGKRNTNDITKPFVIVIKYSFFMPTRIHHTIPFGSIVIPANGSAMLRSDILHILFLWMTSVHTSSQWTSHTTVFFHPLLASLRWRCACVCVCLTYLCSIPASIITSSNFPFNCTIHIIDWIWYSHWNWMHSNRNKMVAQELIEKQRKTHLLHCL